MIVIQKKKKGQALIEFVLILPIFIFMIFACIDFGKILYIKNDLESKMDDVITLYNKEKDLSSIENSLNLEKEKIKLESDTQEKYRNFILKKEIEIITPGLNLILGNPHVASVNRVVYDE